MSTPMTSKSALGARTQLSDTKAAERYLCFSQLLNRPALFVLTPFHLFSAI